MTHCLNLIVIRANFPNEAVAKALDRMKILYEKDKGWDVAMLGCISEHNEIYETDIADRYKDPDIDYTPSHFKTIDEINRILRMRFNNMTHMIDMASQGIEELKRKTYTPYYMYVSRLGEMAKILYDVEGRIEDIDVLTHDILPHDRGFHLSTHHVPSQGTQKYVIFIHVHF